MIFSVNPKYGFILATGFAGLLFVSLLLNWIVNPTRQILRELDVTEYHVADAHGGPCKSKREVFPRGRSAFAAPRVVSDFAAYCRAFASCA